MLAHGERERDDGAYVSKGLADNYWGWRGGQRRGMLERIFSKYICAIPNLLLEMK